jgi:hypothetical protein
VVAQEVEELRQVGAVGLDRLGRHAALIGEVFDEGGQGFHPASHGTIPLKDDVSLNGCSPESGFGPSLIFCRNDRQEVHHATMSEFRTLRAVASLLRLMPGPCHELRRAGPGMMFPHPRVSAPKTQAPHQLFLRAVRNNGLQLVRYARTYASGRLETEEIPAPVDAPFSAGSFTPLPAPIFCGDRLFARPYFVRCSLFMGDTIHDILRFYAANPAVRWHRCWYGPALASASGTDYVDLAVAVIHRFLPVHRPTEETMEALHDIVKRRQGALSRRLVHGGNLFTFTPKPCR